MQSAEKLARELAAVKALLTLRGIDDSTLTQLTSPIDPPDCRVSPPGSMPLAIEVSEYHPVFRGQGAEASPGVNRIPMEKHWRGSLWERLRARGEATPALNGLLVTLQFAKATFPPERHHNTIVSDLYRLLEYATAPWPRPDFEMKVSFSGRDRPNDMYRITGHQNWMVFRRADWAFLAEHLYVIDITNLNHPEIPIDWHSLQAQADWCSPRSDACCDILTKKAQAIRAAITAGKIDPTTERVWLLIVCDTPDDVSSHCFPHGEWECNEVNRAVRGSGFDLSNSPFDEVWLISEATGEIAPIWARS